MSELKPLRAKNLSLPKYGLAQLEWDEVEQAVAAAAPLEGFDVTFDGEAHRVEDPATVRAVAEKYAAAGWPCQAEGDVITAPFSAPSAGPGPWQVWRIEVISAVALKTTGDSGATKWWFR